MKYIYTFKEDDSREYARAGTAINQGAARVYAENPNAVYHVGMDGSHGIPRTFEGAKKRALDLLKKSQVGSVIALRRKVNEETKAIARFRKVDDLPIANTPGVEGIDRWVGYLNANFVGNGTFRFAGICVCKANSDHRDCAACDNFDTKANMEKQRNEAISQASYFKTKYVILYDRIYMPPNFSPQLHGGDYHSHVHISVYGGVTGSAC